MNAFQDEFEKKSDEGTILAIKARNGDVESFEQLVKKYEKFVYTTIYFDVKNREDAYDISQEVFIRVYKSLTAFRGESAFSSWLYRICKNATFDFLRKNAKNKTVSISDLTLEDDEKTDFDIPDTEEKSNPETAIEKSEAKEMVYKAIDTLSDEHKSVILMRDIDGFSYGEISKALGVEEGTVKSRISRAREQLRKHLSDYYKKH